MQQGSPGWVLLLLEGVSRPSLYTSKPPTSVHVQRRRRLHAGIEAQHSCGIYEWGRAVASGVTDASAFHKVGTYYGGVRVYFSGHITAWWCAHAFMVVCGNTRGGVRKVSGLCVKTYVAVCTGVHGCVWEHMWRCA